MSKVVHSWAQTINIYIMSNVKKLARGKQISLFCAHWRKNAGHDSRWFPKSFISWHDGVEEKPGSETNIRFTASWEFGARVAAQLQRRSPLAVGTTASPETARLTPETRVACPETSSTNDEGRRALTVSSGGFGLGQTRGLQSGISESIQWAGTCRSGFWEDVQFVGTWQR